MPATRRLWLVLGTVLAGAACSGPDGLAGIIISQPFTSSISGRVTADGTGVGGVALIAAGVGTTTRDSTATDASGNYRFGVLAAGQYNVTVLVPTGFALSPAQGPTQTVTVTSTGGTTLNYALLRTSP